MTYDMALMSAVIFVPTLFALILMFVPRGMEETMRWLALIGTAVTLALSLVLFIDYCNMLYSGETAVAGEQLRPGEKTSLEARADQDLKEYFSGGTPNGDDLVGRGLGDEPVDVRGQRVVLFAGAGEEGLQALDVAGAPGAVRDRGVLEVGVLAEPGLERLLQLVEVVPAARGLLGGHLAPHEVRQDRHGDGRRADEEPLDLVGP